MADRQYLVIRGAPSRAAQFVEASSQLTATLPATEARLHSMIRGSTVICRASLRLLKLVCHRFYDAAAVSNVFQALSGGPVLEELDLTNSNSDGVERSSSKLWGVRSHGGANGLLGPQVSISPAIDIRPTHLIPSF